MGLEKLKILMKTVKCTKMCRNAVLSLLKVVESHVKPSPVVLRYAEAFIWKCDPHFALFLFSYPAYVCTAAIKDGASRWARPQCGDGSASVAGLAPQASVPARETPECNIGDKGGNASGAPPAVPRRPELGRHHRYSLDARSSATSLRHGTMYIIPIRVIGISAEEENGLPETRNSFLRGPQRTSDSSMLRVSMGSGENLLPSGSNVHSLLKIL
ncbi:hypothetical protein EVAR_99247_1 [Eumeta japonica]|uniref:Uncharacterized protein n=1 Tax=Eumeta variegata TaxID=151549 RepID=A0A4C2A2Y3_EUMVA|nr:hypothetical protein EVAR_99247_1 [Eumeta japonica]